MLLIKFFAAVIAIFCTFLFINALFISITDNPAWHTDLAEYNKTQTNCTVVKFFTALLAAFGWATLIVF